MKENVLNFVRKPIVQSAVTIALGVSLGTIISRKTRKPSFDDHVDSALNLVSDATSTTN